MTLSQIRALMTCRRAMGDLGTDVVVSPQAFERLITMVHGPMFPSTPTVCREQGSFLINTCNGPTTVRRSDP